MSTFVVPSHVKIVGKPSEMPMENLENIIGNEFASLPLGMHMDIDIVFTAVEYMGKNPFGLGQEETMRYFTVTVTLDRRRLDILKLKDVGLFRSLLDEIQTGTFSIESDPIVIYTDTARREIFNGGRHDA